MSTEDDDDNETLDPDRPGVARTPRPDYIEREATLEINRKRRKTGEYQNPVHAARAIRDLERAGSIKTWGMIASVVLGGSGVGHGMWHSNEEEKQRATLELRVQNLEKDVGACEHDVETLQSKIEDERVELAVCCDRKGK